MRRTGYTGEHNDSQVNHICLRCRLHTAFNYSVLEEAGIKNVEEGLDKVEKDLARHSQTTFLHKDQLFLPEFANDYISKSKRFLLELWARPARARAWARVILYGDGDFPLYSDDS